MKSIVKKIPQVKRICDERDRYRQSMLDAQSELEQLRQDFIRIENELSTKNNILDIVHDNYYAMEADLKYERQKTAELYLQYNKYIKLYNDSINGSSTQGDMT